MKTFATSTAGRVVALIIVTSMCLLAAQAATATSPSPADSAGRPVAHTAKGDLGSRIVGSTAKGQKVTGSFVPLKFSKHDGKLFVRGLVQGVVHQADGDRTTFGTLKTIRVKSINGTPARVGRAASARAICDILHLVLAPLDLDLLGLKVHLDRVVLHIVAESGAGNLLGNLLCAVTGLLDGGLGGLLGRLANLLNRILAVLRLG